MFKRIGALIGTGARAFVALIGVAGISVAVANYAVTVGAGTNFGSVVVGGVHYAQQFICDLTTPAQCATVDIAGKIGVKDSDLLAAVNAPIPAQANTTTNIGMVNTQAAANGGVSVYTPFVPGASDNHLTIKNGAGTAYWMAVSNNSATKNYARLYDAGTGFNGCNSATGVIFAFEIPPTDSGFTIPLGGANGIAFSTGLSVCITSGFGLTDTTAATATAMYVNIGYK